MTTTRLVHRTVATLASAGAAAALTLIPAGGAHAAVHGMYAAFGSANAQYTGTSGGTCALSAGDDNPESSVQTFNHGTRHASVHLDATFTNSLNSGDAVRLEGHAASTLTLHRHHGDLTQFALAVGGSISIQHSVPSSECQGSGSVGGETAVQFSEHKSGYFYFTRDTKKPNSFSEYFLINTDTGKLVSLDFFEGGRSHETSRARLKPGNYAIENNQLGVSVGEGGLLARSAPRETKVKLTVSLTGEFKPSKSH